MSEVYDIIVCGLGAMGSAATYYAAKRGAKVLGLDRFGKGHTMGSSHGESRLIRKAYFEHANYVPLLKRAYELWEDLDKEASSNLFLKTGLMIYGPQVGSSVMAGIKHSAGRYQIPVTEFSYQQVQDYLPMYQPPKGYVGLWEKDAGLLRIEECLFRFNTRAQAAGARLEYHQLITAIEPWQSGFRVRTQNQEFFSKSLVAALGGYTNGLLKQPLPINVHKVRMFWFEAHEGLSLESGCPCFGIDSPQGFFYGFPAVENNLIKVALHKPGKLVADPLALGAGDTDCEEDLALDKAAVENFVHDFIPEIAGNALKHQRCFYSMTPDEHFIVDQHPDFPTGRGGANAVIAAGFSGHGFKFASVMGEILADLALTKTTKHDIAFLAAGRF